MRPRNTISTETHSELGQPVDTSAREQSRAYLNCLGGFDEIPAVIVVFLDAGRDSQDVRVENDVVRVEVDLLHQQVVRSRADLDFAIGVGSLREQKCGIYRELLGLMTNARDTLVARA